MYKLYRVSLNIRSLPKWALLLLLLLLLLLYDMDISCHSPLLPSTSLVIIIIILWHGRYMLNNYI